MKKAFIKEIFLSIQGEGPHVGERQLFIRFCGCNMSCNYCDTDFDISESKEYSTSELINIVNKFGTNLTISLTGGEPLVSADFLKEFLPLAKANGHKIYLETNGSLPDKLNQIIDYVDIIAADIKITSATKQNISTFLIDEFFNIASQKETFAKVVFDTDITDLEISEIISIVKKYDIELILQPKMRGNEFSLTSSDSERIFEKFISKYGKTRLIPQLHKFINVR